MPSCFPRGTGGSWLSKETQVSIPTGRSGATLGCEGSNSLSDLTKSEATH